MLRVLLFKLLAFVHAAPIRLRVEPLVPTTQLAASARRVGSFPLPSAAVATIVGARAGSWFPGSSTGVVLTSFNFNKGDGVWTVPDGAGLLRNATPTVAQIDSSISWPNQAELAPADAIPGRTVVLECGGFFPNPSKSTGHIVLTDVTSDPATNHKISTDKNGYFYHRALWHDMDGDGRLDVLAARAHEPLIPITKASGELVWYEQPASNPQGAAWTEHVVISPMGPDVSFIFADLTDNGTLAVVSGNYFDMQQLTLYWCTASSWAECTPDAGNVLSVAIDATIGPVFNLEHTDINGDGRKELLVTSSHNDGKGGVYVYEVPANPYTTSATPWTRHLLAQGFKPITPWLPGQGGPGTARSFYPNLRDTAGKPQVLVTGDDNGTVALLVPLSSNPTNWEYNISTVCVGSGTIGTPAIGDLDGDYFSDLVIPMFADNRVDIYTFAPAER